MKLVECYLSMLVDLRHNIKKELKSMFKKAEVYKLLLSIELFL